MKFIIDAQLPYRLKDWLIAQGFDAIHTRDLPEAKIEPLLQKTVIPETLYFERQTAKTFDGYNGKHRQQRIINFI